MKINIGGEERPVRFGMNAFTLYCELNDKDIIGLGEDLQKIGEGKGTGNELRTIVWACLSDGARKAKIEFNYDHLDVGDWLDDLSLDLLGEFFKGLTESMKSRIPKTDRPDNSKKKAAVSESQ